MPLANTLKACSVRSLLILIFSVVGSVGPSAQEPIPIPTPSKETYDAVIDRVFPREADDFQDPKRKYFLTLRVTPPFKAPSQINIIAFRDGTFEIAAYTLADSSESIGHRLIRILREIGREDVDEMVKRLNVQKHTVKVNKRVLELIGQLSSLRLPLRLSTSHTLDATSYELWYVTPSNTLYSDLAGSPFGATKHENPLVRWMAEVNRTVWAPLLK